MMALITILIRQFEEPSNFLFRVIGAVVSIVIESQILMMLCNRLDQLLILLVIEENGHVENLWLDTRNNLLAGLLV
jgi:hypothetical protein